MLRRFLLVLPLVAGCAVQPSKPAAAPVPPPPSSAEPAAPPAEKPKAVVPAAVPPPPAACAALVAHPTSGCAAKAAFRDALGTALAEADADKRDAALACLEQSTEPPPGFVRALRAEMAPEECGDALVTALLESPPRELPRELESAMLGSVVAARLARLLADPPKPEPPVTKERFQTFFRETLTPWVLAQAAAIEKLSLEGSKLAGYGRAVAALAAGNADLRFVDMVREVPLPEEMQADKAVRDAYYGALDEALEPRKLRGRDAALVGLGEFAAVGAVRDPRVARARALLAKLWSGSRVDALDRLLLPELTPLDASSPNAAVAARLPTFFAGVLLRNDAPDEPKLLRALLERGVPQNLRIHLDKSTSEAVRLLYARALVESGRVYFRARDFAKARALLAGSKDESARFLGALARPLERGPQELAELLLKGPFPPSTDDVSELDAESARKGRYAGRAEFDAAYLLQLAPPADDPGFWDKLALRFAAAAKALRRETAAKDSAEAARAADQYAAAARATAATLRAKK